MDWEQLKYVLAIQRGGSLSAAARLLKVNQSTVSRRLGALETSLDTALFIRSRRKLIPTEPGEKLAHRAERIEAEVMKMQAEVEQSAHQPQGSVRISTMPWICSYLIVPALPEFRESYPGIAIQAVSGLRERSLASREAELALRFEQKPRFHEVCIELAQISYSVYQLRGKQKKTLPWVSFMEENLNAAPQVWMERTKKPEEELVFQANDAGIMYEAVRCGIGKSLLPDVLACKDPSLYRVPRHESALVRTLRILVHEEMIEMSRVYFVIQWLKQFFTDLQSTSTVSH